ncbi:hypothetical protein C5B96_12485 [Subtercola sp. Z020]|uniref:hypothetical protein n=1 Tax=Subtercola sp. Z020 TaxID=2080582 RepID=UPI000CE845A6|nr:hypothetical protein [Subtercola sp. Z020]PPF79528.1 hypothetical protein C5B96_12485 [Subtercola sp. Z020]
MDEHARPQTALWHVDQYDNQSSVSVAATQLDPPRAVTARDRQRILGEWVNFFETARTSITHLRLVSRVPQELLDALAGQPQLRSLEVKWGPYESIAALAGLQRLDHVTLNGATGLLRLAPLTALPELTRLTVSQAHRLHDFETLSEVKTLRTLRFGNASPASDGNCDLPNVSWVTPLSELTDLTLPGTRILDPDLSPILTLTKLTKLTTLGLPLRRSYRKQVFELAAHSAPFAAVAKEYEALDAWKKQHR